MGSEVHITKVDALKLYNLLISGHQKAFSNKKEQEIQQEVSKLWKEMEKENKTLQDLASATEKKTWRVEADRIAKRKENYFLFGLWYAYLVLYKI